MEDCIEVQELEKKKKVASIVGSRPLTKREMRHFHVEVVQ